MVINAQEAKKLSEENKRVQEESLKLLKSVDYLIKQACAAGEKYVYAFYDVGITPNINDLKPVYKSVYKTLINSGYEIIIVSKSEIVDSLTEKSYRMMIKW